MVKCQSFEWKTHKAVLCPRNRYFRAVFTGRFKEGVESTVVLDDDEPFAVECLLSYLYSYRYPSWNSTKLTQCPPNQWEFDIALFKIADKRFVHCLRRQVLMTVIDKLNNYFYWTTDLLKVVVALPFLWEVPAEDGADIRKAALNLMMTKKKDLFNLPDFETLLQNEPKIAFDFFAALANKLEDQEGSVKQQQNEIFQLKQRLASIELADKQCQKNGGTTATPSQGSQPKTGGSLFDSESWNSAPALKFPSPRKYNYQPSPPVFKGLGPSPKS